jgi:hypothetical protein
LWGEVVGGGVITLTGLFSFSKASEPEAAALIAVEDINNDKSLLPDTTLVLNTFGSGRTQAVGPSFLQSLFPRD